jgi:O-antigen/teichoic acid export membrane protein
VSLHRRAFKHYVAWSGWAVLGLSLLSYDVTRVAGDPVYLTGDLLVFPISLGFMAFGIHVLVNNVLYAKGRTKVIGVNMAAAALLNVVLNLVLIPWFGAIGAAVATFASYLMLALTAAYFAEREISIRYAWGRFAAVVLVVAVLYAAAVPSAAWAVGPRLAVRAAAILAYLPLLLITRIYTWAEVQAAWETIKKWRSPGGSG